jgi:hypothetical protein
MNNLSRELLKIKDTLEKVQAYLYHKDAMNANLHMSSAVRSTPLYSSVEGSVESLNQLLKDLED